MAQKGDFRNLFWEGAIFIGETLNLPEMIV